MKKLFLSLFGAAFLAAFALATPVSANCGGGGASKGCGADKTSCPRSP